MPNRVLRDWTDSKPVNSLSWQEEVLFTRIIMKADDYGNFNADPQIVKSLCFPRKNGMRESDISAWLKAIETAGVIRFYNAKGDTFLHIRNFKQRLDKSKRKFPEEPPEQENGNPSVELVTESVQEKKPNESETKQNALTREVVYPFNSDNFKKAWQLWMDYRKEQYGFSYKPIGLQAALNDLKKLAGDSEQKALDLIFYAMSKTWKGIFPINSNTPEGKPTIVPPGAKKKTDLSGNIHKPVQSRINGKKGTITGVVDGTHYLVLFEDGTTNEARPHELYFPPQIPIQKTSEPQSIGNILGNIIPHK